MGREIKAVVVLPPEYREHPEKQYPILYTFHGMGSPYDVFSVMPPLRRALKDKPMIITCMDGDFGGFYVDSPYLQPAKQGDTTKVKSLFTTFFVDEFMPCIDQNYRVNPKQRMLTGLSMGGFAAFHYMLTKPNLFVSISSLSGALRRNSPTCETAQRLDFLLGSPKEFPDRYHNIDINERIQKQLAQGIKMPPIYICCGTEDSHALPNNQEMHKFLTEQGVAHEYVESPGKHEWPYWRDVSSAVIDFHWRSLQVPEPSASHAKHE